MAETGVNIEKAKATLETGGLVAIPTETVYGLAANGFNATAVSNIFKAKNRPSFDPLILHSNSIEKIKSFTKDIPEAALALAEAFWPGSLTLVLPKQDMVPPIVTSGLDTVGVRIPKHPLTLQLLESIPFPLAAPSANPFGYVSPTTAVHVNNNLGTKVDYILDGGACEVGVESTIVGFPNGVPTIFRKGGLAIEEIEKIIGKVEVQATSSSKPSAPGMLEKHYSPGIKLEIGNIPELMKAHQGKNFAVLSFKDIYDEVPAPFMKVLSKSGDLTEAARNLFAFLRYFSEVKPEIIFTELLPENGLGTAINDRLKRAAAQ
ncbi:L-threonylcarbamoyladenylate synthase [Chondrinema litorale]|uniref:L-threonylcarbamoyladenylate synthase n=1 Tax=Chondrinema litorale TaxID=2994555 RepID=UPI002544CCB6|nr:L-threonylcarbamoyladenylate synthase [Chondrinema litorale]UZR94445.1 L-threonylcarbamoyladenylate synthase [Chondrinema litorale]